MKSDSRYLIHMSDTNIHLTDIKEDRYFQWNFNKSLSIITMYVRKNENPDFVPLPFKSQYLFEVCFLYIQFSSVTESCPSLCDPMDCSTPGLPVHHQLPEFYPNSCLNFPGGSDGKVSACNAGDLGSIPGSGGSPEEGNGNPLQYSCLENPMGGGAWQATVHGVSKSQTQLSDFTFFLFFHVH